MNWLRCSIVLLLGATALLGAQSVRADTVCNAKMVGPLNFNSVDPTVRQTTSTIAYDCVTNDAKKDLMSVNLCIAIGTPNRLLIASTGETLAFEIYKDAGHSQIWGDQPTQEFLQLPTFSYSTQNRSGRFDGTITVYGAITDPGLATAAPLTYGQSLTPSLIYNYKEGDKVTQACDHNNSSQSTFALKAEVKVPGRCSVLTATDMNFGTLSSANTGNLASSSTIGLTCSNRTAWRVGLEDGNNSSGGSRQMCIPGPSGACIAYQLLQPDGATPWGNDRDVNTVDGISSGTSQTLTVNGRVNDQPLTQAGRYTDTVKVILTY